MIDRQFKKFQHSGKRKPLPEKPSYQNQIKELRNTIAMLHDRIENINTFETSLRRVIELSLRRIGLYGFILRHRKGFNTVYEASLSIVAQIIALFKRKKDGSSLHQALDSLEVDAYIAVQSIKPTIKDSTIDHFLKHHASFSSVICFLPDENDLQILVMFEKLGKSVQILEAVDDKLQHEYPDIHCIWDDAEDWLKKNGRAGIARFDLLFIGGYCPEIFFSLLRNYIPHSRKLLVNTKSSASSLFSSLGNSKDVAGHYRWIDVVSNVKGIVTIREPRHTLNLTEWPWRTKLKEFPPSMPSGRPWPKISIVTVTRNQGEYIEETIRSVLLQQYPHLEYILIDGASTDRTPVILQRYRNELSVCLSERDDGQADALNKGFRYATGDIMAWLNSDDRYLPTTFIDVALAFDTYTCDMVAGGCALIMDKETAPWRIHHNSMPIGRAVPLSLDRLLDINGSWQKGDFFYQPEVFWTRHILGESGSEN